MKKIVKITSIILAIAMCVAILAACKPDDNTKKYDNEKDRLVLSIDELDGVFNPFFSSSAPDGTIVGMTQVGMLSTDKDGNVAYGNDEPCVVLDWGQKTEGDTVHPTVDNSTTTYTFVLKSGIKFSNGSPLTMRDVLFNLYVYLDPSYTGSATIYSSEIEGLAEYRTQVKGNEKEQEEFRATYEEYAWDRIQRLTDVLTDAYDDFKANDQYRLPTDEYVVETLQAEVDYYKGQDQNDPNNTQWLTLVDDYTRAKALFREELQSDYNLAKGTAEDIKFDEDRQHLNTDSEAFMWNEGFISWNKDERRLEYALGDANSIRNMSEKDVIQLVYDSYVEAGSVSRNMSEVINSWKTASNLASEFTAKAMEDYFNSLSDRVTSVSGIEFANRKGAVTFTNVDGQKVTYNKPTYNSDGSVKEGNEVLQITIRGIDPKAIWNFGFTVAPMYYYSSPEQISLFDYEQHFGVEFGSIDFMNNYVKANSTIGLPAGAGPYKATTANGTGTVTSDSFRENNVVHFERNPYFTESFGFPVKIKYVNYQVVQANMRLESLFNGDIHFTEPNCKQENIDQVNARDGFEHSTVMTNGYGYIGINAEKIPDVRVRRAIMSAIDTSLCTKGYYGQYAYDIYRPMTRASWAYPTETDSEGPYYPYGKEHCEEELTSPHPGNVSAYGQYVKGADGKYTNTAGASMKFTFTIAGDSDDHPAYQAMLGAAEILNELGFDIDVQKDINALKKLNTGDLTVWAAAWGSGVDPDMYQVYHIDSLAGSTANWGYRAIRRDRGKGKLQYEYNLVQDLSTLIDKGRQTLDQSERISIYAQALDKVMELAVEYPTYQRSDMFAYNTNVIDVTTLTPKYELTPFNGPINRLWEVSFVGND